MKLARCVHLMVRQKRYARIVKIYECAWTCSINVVRGTDVPYLISLLNLVEKWSKMTILGDRDFFDQYLADFWQVAGGRWPKSVTCQKSAKYWSKKSRSPKIVIFDYFSTRLSKEIKVGTSVPRNYVSWRTIYERLVG